MTWSLTLAGLPRAGANSKLHRYKQIVQKMKDLPKTWVLRGKQFEDFRRKKKNRNIILDLSKKLSGIQELWARQLNKAIVESKK